MTDTEMILRALKQGRVLTPLEALRDFGCNRLAARVWDLRQMGHQIESETRVLPNKKRIAAYRYIEQPVQQSAGL